MSFFLGNVDYGPRKGWLDFGDILDFGGTLKIKAKGILHEQGQGSFCSFTCSLERKIPWPNICPTSYVYWKKNTYCIYWLWFKKVNTVQRSANVNFSNWVRAIKEGSTGCMGSGHDRLCLSNIQNAVGSIPQTCLGPVALSGTLCGVHIICAF